MNKQLTILLVLSIFAVSVSAQNEKCKDHPWAKRGRLAKLSGAIGADDNADFKALNLVFKSDAADTLEATTDITEAVHPLIPAGWRGEKSCCTADIYAALTRVPDIFVKHVSENPSEFIRVLGGLTKGIAKCGKKAARKGSDGESHDVSRLSAVDLLKRIKVPSATPGDQEVDTTADVTIPESLDGEAPAPSAAANAKFGVEYLKSYYIAKAKIIVAWVQYNRANLFFLCRQPSKAKAALKGGADTGEIQVATTSWNELVNSYKSALTEIRTSLGGFAEVIKFAFRAFGTKQCENQAKKVLTALSKVGPCQKGGCKKFFSDEIKPRPLDIRFVRFLIGKAGNNPDFEGKNLQERPEGKSPFGSKRLRVLNDDEPAPATVADNDANAIASIKVASDANITAGGPYKADGTCVEAGCDAQFQPEASAQFNEQGAVTKDGKPLPATSDDAATTESGSVILSLGVAMIAIFALVF